MSINLQTQIRMTDKAPISFTQVAIETLNSRINQHHLVAPMVRVGVKALGTFSTTFLLAFDQESVEDKIFTIDGFTVLIANKDMMFVIGLEIDFGQKGRDVGFIFNEPA